MKRLLVFTIIVTLVAGATWALKAQTKPPQPSKTYNVSLTKDQWYSVLNGLESIKSNVKLSSMPANQSTYISDSLITIYQVEFSRQINRQLEAEKLNSEIKKDSTSKSKKP